MTSYKGYISEAVGVGRRANYQVWIDAHVPDECKGHCRAVCDKMAEHFEELRVVGVTGMCNGHTWCVDQMGNIIDPTAHQFTHDYYYPSLFLEKEDFPTGKCPYCGELVWPETDGARAYAGEVGTHIECNEKLRQEIIKWKSK